MAEPFRNKEIETGGAHGFLASSWQFNLNESVTVTCLGGSSTPIVGGAGGNFQPFTASCTAPRKKPDPITMSMKDTFPRESRRTTTEDSPSCATNWARGETEAK